MVPLHGQSNGMEWTRPRRRFEHNWISSSHGTHGNMAGSFSIFRAGERGVWNEHGTGCDTQDLSARLSMTFHLLLLLISSTRQLNIPPLEHVASADWHLPRVVVFDYFRCPAIRCSARQGEITRRSNDAHAETLNIIRTTLHIRRYFWEPYIRVCSRQVKPHRYIFRIVVS